MTNAKTARTRNALVHGLYAKDVLLPWDSKDDFTTLHEALKVEFSPRGRAEEEAVLDLAMLHWHKQTVWRMWPIAVLKDPFTDDILQTERKSWSGIRSRLRAAAHADQTLQGTIEAQSAKIMSRLARLNKEIATTTNIEEVKLLESKIGALVRILNEHIQPLTQAVAQGPNAEQAFDKAYSPESMEKIVRLEAALDARISKVLARLVGLKEFKRTPAAGAASMMLTPAPNH
jgi:hypothetical protein